MLTCIIECRRNPIPSDILTTMSLCRCWSLLFNDEDVRTYNQTLHMASNFDGKEKEFPLYLMILISAKLTKSLPTLIIIFGPVVCT